MPKTSIKVRLTGTDGNVFALISRVSKALREGGHPELVTEMQGKVFSCASYDHALQIFMEYVEVS